MPTIDNIASLLAPKNVGVSTTAFDPKLIAGALIVPRGFRIKQSDLATLQTVLVDAANNDSKLNRIYPVSNLVDFKDNSEKAVTQAFSYGAETTVRDGIYKWSFQFVKGGKTLSDALRSFNGSNWDFFLIDQKNILLGKEYTETDGTVSIQAIPAIEIYTQPFGANDGKKVAEYIIEFKFLPKYLNENGAFIADADFDILDIVLGLQDVILTGVADSTSGTYNITVKTALGTNLGDVYGNSSGLVQSACWKATNYTTGASITFASGTPVSYDSATGKFSVKLDTTDPDYPTTGKVAINLVAPTALSTAGVSGYESTGAVAITKN